ncbi:hypothetical protein ETAA8_02300 [Anatilimnocola aggregata]|uniref:Uncharacterized protein n=1 Tax=Anatilimnocola aggregata TaxID=2528021 RepID=A0A517Y4I9_9BACT|nr:hypothetical protein [Anatilimnocola aggregata]QDU25168.1 hypothetical protein ETAA8_02300 [Anatilimnocola aggregata]
MHNPYESPGVGSFDEDPDDVAVPAADDSPVVGEQIGPLHWKLCGVAALIVIALMPRLRHNLLGLLSFEGLFHIVDALYGTVLVAAILLAIWRKRVGPPTFPVFFGHWILLIQGFGWLGRHVYALLDLYSFRSELRQRLSQTDQGPVGNFVGDNLAAINILMILLGSVVPLLAIWYSRGERLWQRYAWVLVLNMWYIAASTQWVEDPNHWIPYSITNFLQSLMAICLIMAALQDVLKGKQRDSLHWLGVAIPLVLTVISLVLKITLLVI